MVREFRVLEYETIIEMLAGRTASALGAHLARGLAPADRIEEANRRQAETAEAVFVCLRKGTPPLADPGDAGGTATLAAKGGALTMRQLLHVASAIAIARQVRAFLLSDVPPEEARQVRRAAEGLTLFPAVEKRIVSSIVSDTEMADGASPALRRLRRQIDAQHDKIREKLARYVSGDAPAGVAGALQDRVVTMRNGRFVVPVKQEQAGRFPGIVHDRSKGGATLFIEPQAVVDLNNKLRELELEEEAEVERILAEMSAEVGACAEGLRENQRLLGELDFAFAKANLALDMKAFRPEIVPAGGGIDIEQGRNPLIPQDRVVPVSVRLGTRGGGGDARDPSCPENVLVVTGPNTGGKTVTLKTVGLFVLMAQSGLFTPAARASLPLARRVFCDIGDEQSIEQNLSTFSAHMKNIVEVCREAGPEDLVLLDELGAGTDPAEGAALAIAVLETLRARGCTVLATTHYTELKKYAVAAEGVENASMEFDVATLAPTFRLLMGSPGRSNAFEISERLGLPEEIVVRARGLLDPETAAFDDVVTGLERDRREAADALAQAERALADAREREREADARLRDAEKQAAARLEKAREDADALLREAEADAEAAAEELRGILREAQEAAKRAAEGGRAAASRPYGGAVNEGDLKRRAAESRKKLQKRRNKDRARPDDRRGGACPARQGDILPPADESDALRVGDAVRIAGTQLTGEVLSAPDDHGRVTVLAGAVRMTIDAASLERTDAAPAKRAAARGSRYANIVVKKMDSIAPSIDLHGETLEEAERRVEKYLDDAVLARMHEVMICHGRGSGALRDGVRRLLRGHKHVRSFRPGHFDEGGDGVTIVTLTER